MAYGVHHMAHYIQNIIVDARTDLLPKPRVLNHAAHLVRRETTVVHGKPATRLHALQCIAVQCTNQIHQAGATLLQGWVFGYMLGFGEQTDDLAFQDGKC